MWESVFIQTMQCFKSSYNIMGTNDPYIGLGPFSLPYQILADISSTTSRFLYLSRFFLILCFICLKLWVGSIFRFEGWHSISLCLGISENFTNIWPSQIYRLTIYSQGKYAVTKFYEDFMIYVHIALPRSLLGHLGLYFYHPI